MNVTKQLPKILLLTTMTATVSLTGCTGLLVGGAVAGGAAAVTTLHDRRTPGTVVDDKNLEIVISRKLYADEYLNDYSHTNLTIFNGVVLVTGEAGTQDIANKIITLIQNTPNVKRVESDIAIMPKSTILSRANDSAITTKVKAALTSVGLPNFDPTLINVSTERGTVYLMGIVTQHEAQAIAERASIVRGVKSVVKVFQYLK